MPVARANEHIAAVDRAGPPAGYKAHLPGLSELGSDPQVFYRAMDFLLDCEEEIQREVFFAVANLLNLEVDVIFFDSSA